MPVAPSVDLYLICRRSDRVVEVLRTEKFAAWLLGLRDDRAKAKITLRLDRIAFGLLGDVKVFDGLTEFRINYGPGYRLYATRCRPVLIVLMCSGDKGLQRRDIARAKAMLTELD